MTLEGEVEPDVEGCRFRLRPHSGISPDKLPLCLGLFRFVHNARQRGKALFGAPIAALVA